jgi:hypothetical protein
MAGMDLTRFVDGMVHEPTQTEGRGLDLTVDAVSRVTEPGRVDFGGGELSEAETEPVETELRDPGDDYGWWGLSEGVYLLAYNERLAAPPDLALADRRRRRRAEGAGRPVVRREPLRRRRGLRDHRRSAGRGRALRRHRPVRERRPRRPPRGRAARVAGAASRQRRRERTASSAPAGTGHTA